ncbi:hypothetical protein ACMD2_20747, partial [Ananas comosus]
MGVRTIQGLGVEPPTPYEISGKYLDAEVNDIHVWVKNFKQQWEIYGVTLMRDSWTGPTKMSIIFFLIYCNGKVIFHKSINTTDRFEDVDYIYALLEQVLREVGEKCVVQVVSDNGANFKKAGKLLIQRHPHLFWTPCAAHCINLMMSDFGEINRYLYNHLWVHALMVKFTGRELVRLGITRFATNFIALNNYVKEIVDIVEPLYMVLRLVDRKKIPQIGHTLGHPDKSGSTPSSGSAKHLKNIVVRVLSQTTTSSECERNWSTFTLIHTKVRNRLAYARLEKLVYIHYNMRLHLRCMQEEYDKEKELKTYDHLDASFINNELDPILDCLQDRDNQENPLLDKPGDSPRPFRIIVDEAGISNVER